MTSTTSASPAQAAPIPPPPAFSYAQAAKGRTAVTPVPSALSNQAASGINTPAKDTGSAANTPSASVNGAATGSEVGDRDRSVNGAYDTVTKLDPLGVGMESESRTATLVNSIPASPSFGTASTSTLPKEEDIALTNATPSESVWDRHSQPANGNEKSTEPAEGRRAKKGKKQKNAEKEAEKEAEKQKEEEKKLELLVAAPPPAVNIWQQRAQALKVKPSPPITQTPQAFTEPSSSIESAAKPSESKRRGKSNVADDGEKTSSAGQTGSAKDLSNLTKGQKKGSEGTSKGKEETANKRAGPRGGRISENEKLINQLPPPVEDAISWPTPETALEEEKRKALEKEKSEMERTEKEKDKEERDEATSNKPRPKEKWVAVPFVPTVNFSTPLPANRGPSNRGGRGRGGARGGRDSTGGNSHTNGGTNGERANNGSAAAASPSGEPETRGRGGSTTTRANSPPNSSKRPSSNTRPQGKSSAMVNAEKTKATQVNASTKNESNTSTESRRTSTVTQIEQPLENQQGHGENGKGASLENAQGSSNETSLKSGAGDRRSEPNTRGSDQFKDSTNFGKDLGQSRDRADGRADRGRGGFRGRGGHNNFGNGPPQPQPAFTNGAPQPPNGFPVRQNSSPYSPSMQQSPFGNQYVQAAPVRGGRGGSRSQSIPNNGVYGRFPQNINPQMTPLQTPNSMYDYQQPPLQTMSAGPYGSYPDQLSLLAMVSMQLEYYFSIDNLCKDVYLRKHMDSQGFVFLNFIAGFKRIQALTQEIELLRYACQESAHIDLIKGEDGVDRLRRKDGWEKWVLAMEERDASVRNPGPSYHQRYDPQRMQQAQQMSMIQGYPAMSPPMFSPTGTESRFPPHYGNGSPVAPILNGNGSNHNTDTPLSATVADFAPSQPPVNGTGDRLEEETTFGDEDVANLKLVFASPKGNDASKAGASFHNASSRTFSNGSIDGRSIAEEMHDDPRQGRGLTNGSRASEISPDGLRRSRSPFAAISPTKSTINNGPPVMWAKGHIQPTSISKDNTDELYLVVRARALKNRELSVAGETHPDMKLLYEFWSHFLCRNFNPTMYLEFRNYAMSDAENNAMDGMKSLISYYDETLNNRKKVIPDGLARHYVDLVKHEKLTTDPSSDRPAFAKLRAAWRNGALDVKSRKKIDNLVDGALKEELDR